MDRSSTNVVGSIWPYWLSLSYWYPIACNMGPTLLHLVVDSSACCELNVCLKPHNGGLTTNVEGTHVAGVTRWVWVKTSLIFS